MLKPSTGRLQRQLIVHKLYCVVIKRTKMEKQPPSRGSKHICVPFDTEAQYQKCVTDVAKYRRYLTQINEQHPELFPQAISEGYAFHDRYRSRKQGVVLRRIKLKTS